MDLPPIQLHASTQTDNRSVEKVKFLEDVGFSQVVLARELSLDQIKEVSSQTTVPLEFFVHGALCVSYSGQCYLSQDLSGRSANRGECAQYCRLPYDLLDEKGNVLMKNKHLLSLKDMNLSNYLSDLLDAGVSSFKIEGRLKDLDYVKNITAYYRQNLDVILEGSTKYQKSSSGKTNFSFTPNPAKSFHRGSTTYFLNGRNAEITSFDTPKSVGEELGRISKVAKNYFTIETKQKLHNGDGLAYISKSGEFAGFRINKVIDDLIYPLEMPKLNEGLMIYRNLDVEFEKQLKGNTVTRKIEIDLRFIESKNGFILEATDEDRTSVSEELNITKELAKNEKMANDNLNSQLQKWGNTDYQTRKITLELSQAYFIPSSALSKLRRALEEKLNEIRSSLYSNESAIVGKKYSSLSRNRIIIPWKCF